MTVNDMIVGKIYLVGDSYGYDIVECLEVNPADTPEGCYGARVRFIKEDREDLIYENPDYGQGKLYIEPR